MIKIDSPRRKKMISTTNLHECEANTARIDNIGLSQDNPGRKVRHELLAAKAQRRQGAKKR